VLPSQAGTGPGGVALTVIDADAAQTVVDYILTLATRVFGTVESLRAATAAAFAAAAPDRPPRAALGALEPIAGGVLGRDSDPSQDRVMVGAGFVALPGALRDEGYWLEWWTDAMRRLAVETDPDAPAFRDYTLLPWFDAPRRTRRRHITGPYVDYLCTDEYTLTFTAPVVVGGRFVGVAGADVFACTVERRLTSLLHGLPEPAAIVNAQGRVVAGNEGAPVTGDLLRSVAAMWAQAPAAGAAGPRLHRCGDLPLAVAVGI
jgi:hypothetical protein